MDKKILVVLTGGTIGSQVSGNIINIDNNSPYRLISMYEKEYGADNVFEVISPLNILSENMTPDKLLYLLKALDDVEYEKYKGVIIAHGSDTLSYTSAFIGYLFSYINVPMVLIASNYPLGQPGSNGLNNFARAVELINEGKLKGVFTLYQDMKGINRVYIPTHIMEAEPYRDQFRDFTGESFGRMENGCFVRHESELDFAIEEINRIKGHAFKVPNAFTNKILIIKPYPGMDYSWIDLSHPPAAIFHLLYHSATVCTEEENHNMLLFAKKCKELSIDIYTASHKAIDGEQYITADALLNTGVKPLLNMSPEAAYAKLMLAYNQ